jgi:hypothetical protein
VINDPNFNARAEGDVAQATLLFDLVREFAFADPTASGTAGVPAPPCSLQGPFRSIGRSPESTDYLHVRRQP